MTKRMLIDATHAEETRVVVTDGNRLEDYDVEAANRKQLKGNIYLAKVIRVEPSLQAAFVEYGGNRHGFLAFSEIHPDYYQIPVADREKLLALQEEEAALVAEEDESEDGSPDGEDPAADEAEGQDDNGEFSDEATPDFVGGETDTGEEALVQKRMARFLRSYKIQEVIRRRQILLVQVVKEERGNKGAALTTYISLAGRYCVLMPNALRGGGVSRKITSVADRKRLKDIISDLQLPRGMAMIVRTAGAQRPRPEVMRDCEYLLHLWDQIREMTLNSVAPALIYEEASLVKRAIRDVYTRDIDEILVDGEQGWRAARDFMRMLMPQSAQKVKLWRKDNQPLFSHHHVEGQLDAMLSPTVQLRSGGYLVINQTEALVSIDVNSGRATRERNIEETAVKTNLEAADEVARQLRLRDLAGLIVIDFIDMESRRHNGQVERRLKEALRHDRARIQVGGISHFGLLEMSRQRLRPSVAESAFMACPHCQGTGIVRGIESSALHVLRAIEGEGSQRRAAEIVVHVAGEIALYILNNKRDWLAAIETRHKMRVQFAADASLPAPEIRIERRRAQTARFDQPSSAVVQEDQAALTQEVPFEAPFEEVLEDRTEHPRTRLIAISDAPPADHASGDQQEAVEGERSEEEQSGRRRRRRRRRRGGNRDENGQEGNGQDGDGQQVALAEAGEMEDEAETSDGAADENTENTMEHAAYEAQENLVPGRSRTRHSRRQPAAAPRRNPAVERAENTRQERSASRPVGWRGPTPADPFGGGFDIFDLMGEESFDQPVTRTSAPPVTGATAQARPVVRNDVAAVEEVTPAPQERTPSRGRGRRGGVRRNGTGGAEATAAPVVDAPETAVPAQSEQSSIATKETETKETERKAVVVEPTVIDDTAPAAKPRKGWWNR